MELSQAETFLMGWAVVSTILAVIYKSNAQKQRLHHRKVAVLLAKLASGKIKATHDEEGFTVVEDDDMCMKFKSVQERVEL
jgi:hypothetical protein